MGLLALTGSVTQRGLKEGSHHVGNAWRLPSPSDDPLSSHFCSRSALRMLLPLVRMASLQAVFTAAQISADARFKTYILPPLPSLTRGTLAVSPLQPLGLVISALV